MRAGLTKFGIFVLLVKPRRLFRQHSGYPQDTAAGMWRKTFKYWRERGSFDYCMANSEKVIPFVQCADEVDYLKYVEEFLVG